jgi:hypothetical protein
VRFVLDGMIEAEELGINQKNVDEMLKSDDPVIKRFLGITPGYGKAVGVELRRQLRAQRRQVHPAQARARPERAVDQRRPDVRDPVPLRRIPLSASPPSGGEEHDS